jgi:endonuclease-8
VPEGDAVHRTANRLRAALVGQTLLRSDFRVPQYATVDLSGQQVTAFEAVGKHLLTRFSGGLTLHTHLLMEGSWTTTGAGKHLPSTFGDEVRIALVTTAATGWALRMQVVDLLDTAREADVVGHLGPDLLGAWDLDEALARLRAVPDVPIIEALLDQKNLSGLGNVWVNEVCFLRGVSPWTAVAHVDLELLVRLARKLIPDVLTWRVHSGAVGWPLTL